MQEHKTKITTNYHTHTKRCGHALGEDEDYVLGALQLGITDLGFSDHVPLQGLSFPHMRQDYAMFEDYKNAIWDLQKKYCDKIRLRIGYEAEYIPEFIPQYEKMRSNGVEYFICGQHCFIKNGEQVFYNSFPHSEEMVARYIDALICAMKSGLFAYIAHPDLFMNGYRVWDDFAVQQSRRLLEEAEKSGTALEINVAGIRFAQYKHRTNGHGMPVENLYPYAPFWRLASQYEIKGIIGIDAHRREDFADGAEQEALEFAQNHNIQLLASPFDSR